MKAPLHDLYESMLPIICKHPEAVTIREVIDLQIVCKHIFHWCEQLNDWNERAGASLVDANDLIEELLSDG